MKAAEVIFQDLLGGRLQYRVPLFQREYKWERDNWQLLWDNILEIYALPVPRSHFIGAIVTLPIPDAPERAAKFMLIDGQQRMTTLFILLAVIRDAAKETTTFHGLADQITDECLINKYATSPDEREKFRPTEVDIAGFCAVIAGSNSPDGRIAQARALLRDELANGDLNDAPIDLVKLKNCVTNYLSLVSIRLDQQDSPHRIFESLNNAGMPLSASDLVRNHIFMRITNESEQKAAYNAHWLPMQRRTEYEGGKSGLTDFFWRYLMKDGELPRYDEVFESMRERIDAETKPENNRSVVQVLEELNRYSEHYVRFWSPLVHEPSPPLKDQFLWLNTWEVDVAYPFMLHSFERLRNGDISEVEVLAVMKLIESYIVRRFVCGIPTNRLRRIFAQMNKQLQGDDFVQACRSYLQRNDWPTNELFRDRFQSTPLYIESRTSRVRLILNSLERSYDHKESVNLTDAITIEHVMPQTLNDAWQTMLGPTFKEVHARYLHTIGNLTFSGYNSQMGNSPFDSKQKVLAQSHFELNKSITTHAKWTADEIKQRAAELADRAVVIWQRDA